MPPPAMVLPFCTAVQTTRQFSSVVVSSSPHFMVCWGGVQITPETIRDFTHLLRSVVQGCNEHNRSAGTGTFIFASRRLMTSGVYKVSTVVKLTNVDFPLSLEEFCRVDSDTFGQSSIFQIGVAKGVRRLEPSRQRTFPSAPDMNKYSSSA